MCEDFEKDFPFYEELLAYLITEAFNPSENPPQYIQEEDVDDWLDSLLS